MRNFIGYIAILLLLASCRTATEYVNRDVFRTDTLYQIREYHDTLSIYSRDSVYVSREVRNDTVFLETVRWKDNGYYNAKAGVDTVYKSRTDTVYIDRWVETTTPDAVTFRTGMRVGMFIILLLALLLFLGFKALRKL